MIGAVESLPSIKPSAPDAILFLATMRNLVMLIHYLEYAVTQAISKNASLHGPPYSACLFFISQKTMFRDWISRLRRHLITACHYCSVGSSWIVYHGEKYLVESMRALKGSVRSDSWLDSFTSVYILMGRAYADLGDCDALCGILKWCRDNLRTGLGDMGRGFEFYERFFEACCMISKVLLKLAYG
jgi:hypothetical protein